jgi:hypothetical protein
VQYSDDIYRKNLGTIKGKTVRREVKLPAVSNNEVPAEILPRYHDVTLSAVIGSIALASMRIETFPAIKHAMRSLQSHWQWHSPALNAMTSWCIKY